MKTVKALTIISALAHESRLSVFRLLLQEGEKGLSAGAIAENLHIPSATLSFHLSQLHTAELVVSHRVGRMIIYKANYKRIKKLVAYLTEGAPKTEKLENSPVES